MSEYSGKNSIKGNLENETFNSYDTYTDDSYHYYEFNYINNVLPKRWMDAWMENTVQSI